MNGQPTIQYLGFRPSPQGRVRFQDAPGICSQRLQRELAAAANHPQETRYHITAAELAEYRAAHAPRTPGRRS